MRKWLVLHTKSSRERQVVETLGARGIETYWPIFYRRSKSGNRPYPKSFFPGYVFARVDPLSPEFTSVPWTPGLRNIVEFGGKVVWVPDELLAQLGEAVEKRDEVKRPPDAFPSTPAAPTNDSPPADWLSSLSDPDLSDSDRLSIFVNEFSQFVG